MHTVGISTGWDMSEKKEGPKCFQEMMATLLAKLLKNRNPQFKNLNKSQVQETLKINTPRHNIIRFLKVSDRKSLKQPEEKTSLN